VDVAVCWGRISYLNESSSKTFPEGRKQIIRTVTNECIHGGSTVTKRLFYLNVGGFDERFEGWGAEDDAFYEKTRKLGKLVRVNPAIGPWLYHLYHTHGKNKHQHWPKNKQYWLQYCLGTAQSIKIMMPDPSTIGDPNRGIKLTKSPLNNVPFKPEELYRRLHVIYDVPGWAYWHRYEALKKYAPLNWTVTGGTALPTRFELNPPDIVLLLNYSLADRVNHQLRKYSPRTLLVGSMNVGWPRRLEFLMKLREKCNHVIINNVEMYLKCGCVPGTSTISNGVDTNVFYPNNLLGFNRKRRVLWTGSVYHAALKGYSIIKSMSNGLNAKGIDLDLRLVDSHGRKYSHPDMAAWYNTGSCYVVGSETEGTPNPALEAAACGLPIVSTRVGNMPELIQHKINGYLVEERSARALQEGITFVNDNFESMSLAMLETIKGWSWKNRSQKYFELFDILLRGETPTTDWNITNSSEEVLDKVTHEM
jgi:glycosyltransferase involved in cell wall biosynthesis